MAAETATIKVRVQPGARKEQVLGYSEGVLRVHVTAPPVEGKANAAVMDLLSRVLGVRSSQITILRGLGSRDKVLRVKGLSQEQAETLLSLHGSTGPTCRYSR